MVRFIDFVLAFLFSLFIGVILASPTYAAGSISREEFLETIGDDSLRGFVEANFKISESGLASRGGAEEPERAGERMPPFEIVARLPYGHERFVLRVDDRLQVVSCAESFYYAPYCLE